MIPIRMIIICDNIPIFGQTQIALLVVNPIISLLWLRLFLHLCWLNQPVLAFQKKGLGNDPAFNWLVPKLQGGAGLDLSVTCTHCDVAWTWPRSGHDDRKSPLSCEATQCFGHEGDPVIRLSVSWW